MPDHDTLIIGAGAAGLAAAAELSRRGRSVCLLEARERLGGRIHTLRPAGVPVPLELGAELIHGRPQATLEWLARGNAPLLDVTGSHWTARGARLERSDRTFAELKSSLAKIRMPRADVPFDRFLAANRGRLSRRVRELARTLVEGYDAADATRASTVATLEEWRGQGAADAPTFRPLGGYGALVEALCAALDPVTVQIRLRTVVQEVRWTRGHVRVRGITDGRSFELEARRAVIALPLGVLQRSAVRFAPELAAKARALSGLAAGPVVKVILEFGRAFWEELDGGRYCDAAFFHSPRASLPTFWTTLPIRTPFLTGWAGGPKAAQLTGASNRTIATRALQSLESLFGARRKWRAPLRGLYLHDWQVDPLACGGYSYVVSGAGATARTELARPLAGTLFFAGEAADTQGESGTVAGALQSGRRAALEVLRSQRRSGRS